jgi:hypothetical protein
MAQDYYCVSIMHSGTWALGYDTFITRKFRIVQVWEAILKTKAAQRPYCGKAWRIAKVQNFEQKSPEPLPGAGCLICYMAGFSAADMSVVLPSLSMRKTSSKLAVFNRLNCVAASPATT